LGKEQAIWAGHLGGTGWDWKTIAAVVFGTQVVLFLVSLVADAIWLPVSAELVGLSTRPRN
jgi:uncharacterized membrane protein YtjA (UPF0391 family)